MHKGMQEYIKELLKLYQSHTCLYEIDNKWDGFEWINSTDTEKSTYSFIRKNAMGTKNLLFVLNFTPIERKEYRIGVPELKKYKLLLNSDEKRFGGEGLEQPKDIMAEKVSWDGKPYSIPYALPSFGAAVFEF